MGRVGEAVSDKFGEFFKRLTAETELEGPHGWIQWKGTNVCIDLRCKCGHLGHVDDEFFYGYQCPACGTKYHVGAYVKLVEALPGEEEHVYEFKQPEKTERELLEKALKGLKP